MVGLKAYRTHYSKLSTQLQLESDHGGIERVLRDTCELHSSDFQLESDHGGIESTALPSAMCLEREELESDHGGIESRLSVASMSIFISVVRIRPWWD